jgi:hypothetical protein
MRILGPSTGSSLRGALGSELVVSGRDVGSAPLFFPVDGETFTLTVDLGGFVDDQTGSGWEITGTAVSGDLAGTSPEPIQHLDTFQPETDLIEAPGES